MPRVVVGQPVPARFLTTSWSAPTLAVTFPDECPHCGGRPVRRRVFSTERPTSAGFGSYRTTTMMFEVPVCRRVLPSLVTRLLAVACAFWVVVFALALVFSVREGPRPATVVGFAVALALTLVAVRAHTWFRVATFDPGSVTFAVRRRAYAAALAARNPGPGR